MPRTLTNLANMYTFLPNELTGFFLSHFKKTGGCTITRERIFQQLSIAELQYLTLFDLTGGWFSLLIFKNTDSKIVKKKSCKRLDYFFSYYNRY